MGKNKGIHKNKNVFKVSTVRSIKLKAQAQKVKFKLKKLDLKLHDRSNQDVRTTIDKQLTELRKEVHQTSSKSKCPHRMVKQTAHTQEVVSVNKPTTAQTEAIASEVEGMQI